MERYEAFNNFYGEGYEEILPRELVEAYDIIECLSCVVQYFLFRYSGHLGIGGTGGYHVSEYARMYDR